MRQSREEGEGREGRKGKERTYETFTILFCHHNVWLSIFRNFEVFSAQVKHQLERIDLKYLLKLTLSAVYQFVPRIKNPQALLKVIHSCITQTDASALCNNDVFRLEGLRQCAQPVHKETFLPVPQRKTSAALADHLEGQNGMNVCHRACGEKKRKEKNIYPCC